MGYRVEVRYLTSHGQNPEMLSSPEDVDAFVDRLLAQSAANNLAELYLVERLNPDDWFPNHYFQVGVDKDHGVGALKYNSADGGFASFAPWDADSQRRVVYNMMGTESDFPAASEIPLDHVRAAVKEFLANGGYRPDNVQWQEDTTL